MPAYLYHGTQVCSKKKPPVGPVESRSASQTIPAAACSTVRCPVWLLKSVAVEIDVVEC